MRRFFTNPFIVVLIAVLAGVLLWHFSACLLTRSRACSDFSWVIR
jgi:hypothetical protein